MIFNMVALLDTAVGAFQRPIFVRSKGEAIRILTDEANTPDSQISKHAKDFRLFDLGTFDDGNGHIHTHEVPQLIINVSELKKPE